MASTVVITAPTSTTNITGFFIMVRGLSLMMESVTARLTIGGSNSGRERAPRFGIKVTASTGAGGAWFEGSISGMVRLDIVILAPEFALHHQEVLDNRTQRKRREEGKRPN